jgi:MerR family transcriptional regulator, copper efflux regulator
MDSETHHIGEVAARVGLSLRTLRHYEEVGLVAASGRSDGGFRLYTEEDIRRLILVRTLRPAEFSLEELPELLQLRARADAGTLTDEERARLAGFVDTATERLRLQRERLIAAELAVDRLRAGLGSTRTPVTADGPGHP